jgi:hypothetical protein
MRTSKTESTLELSRAERVHAIAQEWVGTTFVDKNTDYGNSYIVAAETLRLWFPDGVVLDTLLKTTYYQLLVRMLDKLIRTTNLVLRQGTECVQDEKAYVTIADNGVYSFMAAEVLKHGVE